MYYSPLYHSTSLAVRTLGTSLQSTARVSLNTLSWELDIAYRMATRALSQGLRPVTHGGDAELVNAAWRKE